MSDSFKSVAPRPTDRVVAEPRRHYQKIESRISGLSAATNAAARAGNKRRYASPRAGMDIPAQQDHPRYVAAVDALVAACRRHGKAAGFMATDDDWARRYRDAGFG